MAGGMERSAGRSLAERRRAGAGGPTAAADDGAAADGPVGDGLRRRSVGLRHCWVTGLPGGRPRQAALLVAWRPEPDGGWFGRVVYVLEADGREVLVEAWVAADRLEPVQPVQPVQPVPPGGPRSSRGALG